MKKGDASIMHMGDIILAAAAESGINENCCLLNNQPTCNVFINVKCLSNIRDAPDRKYLRVYCNSVVTHTKQFLTSPDVLILSGITPR